MMTLALALALFAASGACLAYAFRPRTPYTLPPDVLAAATPGRPLARYGGTRRR